MDILLDMAEEKMKVSSKQKKGSKAGSNQPAAPGGVGKEEEMSFNTLIMMAMYRELRNGNRKKPINDDFVDDVVSAPAAVEDITEGAGSDDEEEEEAMPPPPPAAGKKAPKSPLVSSDTDSPNPEVSTPSP